MTETGAEPVHTIEWYIDRDSVYGAVTCTAVEGAPCRMSCPHGCPTWPCGHDLTDQGDCNAVEWFDNCGVIDSYGGDRRPLRSGPVEVVWNGDAWVWTYPPADVSSGDVR